MNQIITVNSDECNKLEIRDVMREYILQENLILCRESEKTSSYLRK